jgi:hypothetical protein
MSLLHNTTIQGYLSTLDNIIYLPTIGSANKLKNPNHESYRTYLHEWTHYFQLTSTNFGQYFIGLVRELFWIKYRLIISCHRETEWKFDTPLIEFLENNKKLSSNVKELYSNFKELDSELEKLFIRIPAITEIDTISISDNNLLINNEIVQISALQILEHAAICIEAMFSDDSFRNEIDNNQFLDYFVFFKYFEKKGIIKIETVNNKKQITNFIYSKTTSTFFATLFLFTQIAFSISEYGLLNNKQSFRAEMENIMKKSFLKLLKNFDEIYNFIEREYEKKTEKLSIIDEICLKYFDVSFINSINLGLDRMKFAESQIKSNPTNNDFHFSPISNLNITKLKTNLLALKEKPGINITPLMYGHEIPLPYIISYDENDLRRRIMMSFPWLTKEPIINTIKSEYQSMLLEDSRIIDDLFFNSNKGCYPHELDYNYSKAYMVWDCDDFKNCWKRKQNCNQNFCTNESWKSRRDLIKDRIDEVYSKKSNL